MLFCCPASKTFILLYNNLCKCQANWIMQVTHIVMFWNSSKKCDTRFLFFRISRMNINVCKWIKVINRHWDNSFFFFFLPLWGFKIRLDEHDINRNCDLTKSRWNLQTFFPHFLHWFWDIICGILQNLMC